LKRKSCDKSVCFIKPQFKIISPVLLFSLFLGGYFTPFEARAGFLPSVFGSQASAETKALTLSDAGENSQNMTLLQANVFSVFGIKDNKVQVGGSVDIVSDNALLASVSPLGSLNGTGGADFFSSDDQVSVYVVRKGDSVSQVAEMFGVSVDTVLSANDMKKGDKLKEGDILLILPFSGVEHTVVKGQTLQAIANLYKVDINDILFFNDIESNAKISIGEKLMVPGASMPNEAPKRASSGTAKLPLSISSAIKNIQGYFINPVPSGRRTRTTSASHKGVDIGAPTGAPIYASASGSVTFARTGYNGGFGTLVILSHANGTRTLYAHMSRLGTTPGAQVTQGEIIGYVGSTGRSTGPHLHFEVQGAKNPGNDWSWAR